MKPPVCTCTETGREEDVVRPGADEVTYDRDPNCPLHGDAAGFPAGSVSVLVLVEEGGTTTTLI